MQSNFMNKTTPRPELVLITPEIITPTHILQIATEITGASVVIVRFAPQDERSLINALKSITIAFQTQNMSVIAECAPDFAIKAGADGVHCYNIKQYDEAAHLQPKKSVGAIAPKTRDALFDLAESGVDYLLYPNDPQKSFDAYIERLEWAVETLNLPAIGIANTLDEVSRIVETGVEYVGVSGLVFENPLGVKEALAQVKAAMVA
jgi:thiamine-phosphate pyrophosphorylase